MIFSAKRELLGHCLPEIKPILQEHWEELALNKAKIALNPDYDTYLALEKAGHLRAYVVRTETGEVAGYGAFIINRHLHYNPHVWALSDLFFIRRQFRRKWWSKFTFWRNAPPGAGTVLFDLVESDLTEMGASVLHCTLKTHNLAAAKMFESRGYSLIELGYSKPLR